MKKTILLALIIVINALFLSINGQQVQFDPSTITIIEGEKKAHDQLFLNDVQKLNGLVQTSASNNFNVNYYRCEWIINPDVRYISGKVTSYFTINVSSGSITYDLSDTLAVDSILYHGSKIAGLRKANDALEIQFPTVINSGTNDSISIFYKGTPRVNVGFGAFTRFIHSGVPVIWTLSEPYGAKEWWPCKNGLNDKADSIDISITSPIQYRGSTNGVQIAEDSTTSERTVYFKHRFPIASYLVCAAVTNYQVVRDEVMVDNKPMPLFLTTYPEWLANASKINDRTKKAFALLNDAFGAYPFAKEQYGHTAWNWSGGMEHQTNSFISTTDEQLLTHELGHQWFGDWITCGSWKDIWLNEGFASYTWIMYVEKYYPDFLQSWLNSYIKNITSQNDGSVIVDDTSSASRVFSGRLTYAKGAYVVHMLRGVLGDEAFSKGVRQYLKDPKLVKSFAVTEDLKRNLEQVSGKNLQSFFQKWLYGQGYPNYSAEWSINNNGWVKVTLKQSTSHSSVSFFDMPVQLKFKNAARDTTFRVNHNTNGELFWLNTGFIPDTLMIDPNNWILAKDRISKKTTPISTTTDEIKIHPNPAPEIINISLYNPTFKRFTIELFNTIGQRIYTKEQTLLGSDEQFTIPTLYLLKGVYYLKISNESKFSKTYKILR